MARPPLCPPPDLGIAAPSSSASWAATYDKIVALENFAKSFGLSIDSVRAVAAQAAHLLDMGGHSLVETVASVVHNSWQLHVVSAAHNGRKTTVSCYRTAVMAYCGLAAEKYGDEAVILPVSRTAAVTFLDAERVRRVLPRKRRHSEDVAADGGGSSSTDDGEEQEGRWRGGESDNDATGEGPRDGGGALAGEGASGGSANLDGRRGAAALGTDSPLRAGPRAAVSSAARGAGEDGRLTPSTGGVRSAREEGDAAGRTRAARGRHVGPQVVLNDVNALSKIGNTFNLLWRDAKCACCERWWPDDYDSVGSYAPARAVFDQRTREKVLEDHAAGSSKAVGPRDPSVSEEQWEEASRRLRLTPTTAVEYQLKSVLASLFMCAFSLDARGGTARGVTWSDLAVRRLTAMFSGLGGPIFVLCKYITASKTMEGIVHIIGALGHVNAWLCPVGAMADALVANFESPGMDETRPPVTLSPVFDPTDA